MTVKYSLDLNQKIKPCTNRVCKSCGLYLNQLPVCEKATDSHIFWVGLSAVLFNEGIEKLPLSPLTRSGALIGNIEESLSDYFSFYKTNIVKCLPLKEGKIRYPLEHEMEKCFPNFEFEVNTLKPKIVFLLGKQVSTFVMNKLDNKNFSLSDTFNYTIYNIGDTIFVPIHHPSFILIYKRKFIENYIDSIRGICKQFVKEIVVQKRKRKAA